MNIDLLKELATTILVETARSNYQEGLEVEADANNLNDDQYAELENLLSTAKITITWK